MKLETFVLRQETAFCYILATDSERHGHPTQSHYNNPCDPCQKAVHIIHPFPG